MRFIRKFLNLNKMNKKVKKNLYQKSLFLSCILVIFFSFILQIFTLSNGHEWGDDFALYVMQSISIIENSELTLIDKNSFMLNQSSKVGGGPFIYPWGLPILQSIIYYFFSFNLIAYKLLNILSFTGFLIVSWFFFKKKLTLLESFFLLSFFAFNPFLLKFNDQILSDIPFLFFSFISIFTIYLFLECKKNLKILILALLLGLLFTISYLIRFHGIILPITYSLILILIIFNKTISSINVKFSFRNKIISSNNQYFKNYLSLKFLLHLIPIISFIFFTILIESLFPSIIGSTTNTILHKISYKTILFNFVYNLTVIRFFFNEGYLGLLMFIITIPFVFIGVYKKIKDSKIIMTYTILTFILYLVHPFNQGLRFFFSILPFYLYFFLIGLRIFKNISGKLRYFNFLLIALYLIFFITKSFSQINSNFVNEKRLNDGPYTREAMLMFQYIKKNVSDKEIVVFRKPRAMRLFTGKDSLTYSSIDDFKYRNWYVIDKDNLGTIDRKKNLLFSVYPAHLVFENSKFQIYKFK
jgi:hypothetical protein